MASNKTERICMSCRKTFRSVQVPSVRRVCSGCTSNNRNLGRMAEFDIEGIGTEDVERFLSEDECKIDI